MASPQKENGYTAIANELLDQIYSRSFNATQLKIIFLIIRYTYGFNRKSHEFALNFIVEAIGGDKRNIQKELNKLFDGNVILILSEATFKKPRELAINKNYETWSSKFRSLMSNSPTDGELTTPTDGELTTPTDGELTTPTDGELTTPTDGELTTQERNIKDNIKDNINTSISIDAEADKPLTPKPKKNMVFIPPTLDQIQEYCIQENIQIDTEYWLDYYKANGWMVGNKKMRDWKATIRNWDRKNRQYQQNSVNVNNLSPPKQYQTKYQKSMQVIHDFATQEKDIDQGMEDYIL